MKSRSWTSSNATLPSSEDLERVSKRLTGIAAYWHSRFGLPNDAFDDILQNAWLEWLERKGIEDDRRMYQVWSATRRAVIRHVWGAAHKKITDRPRPTSNPALLRKLKVDSNLESSVMLKEIVEACTEDKHGDHLRTVAMYAGVIPWPAKKSTKAGRYMRLRRFLRQKGLMD